MIRTAFTDLLGVSVMHMVPTVADAERAAEAGAAVIVAQGTVT